MAKYPLALLPVVTIESGRARLAPHGPEASTETGTPAQSIASWVAKGAAWIHVIDQDAIDGKAGSHAHIVSSGAHLQYSGAVRDAESLAAALATGASRVVIEGGEQDWVDAALREHGERVAVGLDIRQDGVFELRSHLESAGCRRFVVTDNAESHHWKHGDRHLLGEFCQGTNRPVMARGGIRHLNDLHELHELVPNGLDGIIIGDALYDGAFMYSEAVAAGADRFDMFYWGPPQP